MKNILVTGGCGFIGSHLVEAFLREGHAVRILDRKERLVEKYFNHVTGHLDHVTGDICDPQHCHRACEGIDVVFHNAALSILRESFEKSSETSKVNIEGTRNLLQACADNGVKRFVFSSTGKVYGDAEQYPCTEDTQIKCTSPYTQTKTEAEHLCRQFTENHDFKIIVLRYLSVYGPGQRLNDTLIGEILMHASDEDHTHIHATATMERDFTYIDDVVQANLLSLAYQGPKYDVFNIGSGKSYSVETLFKLISSILKKNIVPMYEDVKEGTVMKTEVDIAKAHRLLNYDPKVALLEGLVKTIDWIKIKDSS